ncbi:MAG: MbcA/ParS/Xre antitoxin family protein [Pseudomonadota bacterium]|nr:MbcA/ParS/Xre antitoxin family protein [Pseudomonadota bacterium]
MSQTAVVHASKSASPRSSPAARRHWIDAALMKVFASPAVRRALRDQQRLNLAALGEQAFRAVESSLHGPAPSLGAAALTTHRRLVEGLPGQSVFVASGLAFDTLAEALPFLHLTAKTAWQKLDANLSSSQSEQALRLGRIAVMAAELMGSAEDGRRYLRTPNFALGGATPLELLKTAEGEQLVLAELQAQADGGPV